MIVWHFCLASTADRGLIGFRKTCFHIDCVVDIQLSIVSVQKGSANTERLRAWKQSLRGRRLLRRMPVEIEQNVLKRFTSIKKKNIAHAVKAIGPRWGGLLEINITSFTVCSIMYSNYQLRGIGVSEVAVGRYKWPQQRIQKLLFPPWQSKQEGCDCSEKESECRGQPQ